jgi:hypothetical protein
VLKVFETWGIFPVFSMSLIMSEKHNVFWGIKTCYYHILLATASNVGNSSASQAQVLSE